MNDRIEDVQHIGGRHPKYVAFVVEGSGEFPFDMLRYDACFPSSGEDARAISGRYGADDDHPELVRRRRVRLLTAHPFIHPARWASFRWNVVEVES